MTFDNVFDCVVWLLQRDFLHREKKSSHTVIFARYFAAGFFCRKKKFKSRLFFMEGRTYFTAANRQTHSILRIWKRLKAFAGSRYQMSFLQKCLLNRRAFFLRRDFQCLLETTSRLRFLELIVLRFFFFPLAVSFTSLFLLVPDQPVVSHLNWVYESKKKEWLKTSHCDVYAR